MTNTPDFNGTPIEPLTDEDFDIFRNLEPGTMAGVVTSILEAGKLANNTHPWLCTVDYRYGGVARNVALNINLETDTNV